MRACVLLFSFVMMLLNLRSAPLDFAPVGAVWYYTEQFAFQGDINYLTIRSVKDTTIQGYSCRRLDCKPLDGFPSGRQYIRYANDSLYRYVAEFNSFQLMAAFNAQTGDSWNYFVKDWDESIDTVTVKVNSVERVTINQQSLRKLSVRYVVVNYDIYGDSVRSTAYDSQIIEKIGDTHYLFNFPISASIVFDGNYSAGLRCYEDAEFGLYSTGIAESCTWVGIESYKTMDEIRIFPNPTSGLLYLKVPDQKAITIHIKDLTGRIMFTQKPGFSQSVDLTTLPEGLYILTITDKNGNTVNCKVVKR